jgi:predicted Ser/Thr protein kinase
MSDIATANTALFDYAEDLYGAELGCGAMVGVYVVDALCSRGGFGTVYRATGPAGETVAIKLLHRTLAESSTTLRRFQQEVELVRSLAHPGIVEIIDVGDLSDGRPYIVMEWLEGRTLEEVLSSEGAISPTRALAIMEKLCDALSIVHAAGIIHRDLKGANVMVQDSDGADVRIKLLDFGVAKLLERDSGLTVQGARIGTPTHMAPEQILGQRVGPETDIYALGVMLFTMLTGRLPYQAPTPVEVEAMHINARVPKPSDVGNVPESVSEVVQRCLAKKTFQRYGSVEDLIADLRSAVMTAVSDPSALRSGRSRAVGVFIAVDPAVTDVRATLDDVRAQLNKAGFEVALEDDEERWVLGVIGLPGSRMAERDARARALETALAIVAPTKPNGTLRAVVHAAGVVTLLVEGALQLVGGELLSPEEWATKGAYGCVEVTSDVLAGIQAEITTVTASRPGLTAIQGLKREATRNWS